MSTIKIFIGNLSDNSTVEELRALFEQFGAVVECDIVKNFGFVHMEVEEEAKAAIAALNGYNLNGCKMNVELSTGKNLHGRRKSDFPSASGGRGGRGRRPESGRFQPYGGSRGGRGGGSGSSRGGRGNYSHYGGADDGYDAYDQDAYDELYREVYRDAYMQAYKDLCRDLASREAAAEARKSFHRDPPAPPSLSGADPYRRPPPEYYEQLSGEDSAPIKYPGLESSYASSDAPRRGLQDPYARPPSMRPMMGRGGMPM